MDEGYSLTIIAACLALPHVNSRIAELNNESARLGNNVIADKRRKEIRDNLEPLHQRRSEFRTAIFGRSNA